MKLDREAVLTCSACGVDGPHELLYLSEYLRGSRCLNCGKNQVFTSNIYMDYARDLAERTAGFPGKFVGDVLKRPTEFFRYPFKVIGKPLKVLEEVTQVTDFEHRRHSRVPGPLPRG